MNAISPSGGCTLHKRVGPAKRTGRYRPCLRPTSLAITGLVFRLFPFIGIHFAIN